MDKILKCEHSNESYREVLFCGTLRMALFYNLSFNFGWEQKCQNQSRYLLVTSETGARA